jgi:hypothetical protein
MPDTRVIASADLPATRTPETGIRLTVALVQRVAGKELDVTFRNEADEPVCWGAVDVGLLAERLVESFLGADYLKLKIEAALQLLAAGDEAGARRAAVLLRDAIA